MNPIVYTPLLDLHARWGPQEFGKIAQKFLAIAFRYAGYQRIVERGVQGVDVDAAGDGDANQHDESSQAHGGGGGAGAAGGDRSSSTRTG